MAKDRTCNVIIKQPQKNKEFILYNHLYARKNKTFTVNELAKELQQYHVRMTKKAIQHEINEMASNGLVIHEVGAYTFVDT